ncbi:MAG: HD domain-containing protein [Gammaproteobacteria bacterium]|nr:HD domain-containing protein [Gammaproteobacteria bacterium]
MKSNNIAYKLSLSAKIASFLLLIFIIISLWLIFEYAEKERNRDLLGWQSRLALLAEIRVSAIEDFLSETKNKLSEFADNSSLKLFLTEYKNRNEIDEVVLNGLQAHVRNLLRANADRFGFTQNTGSINKPNTSRVNEYGLAILDSEHQLIMSTRGFSETIEEHNDILKKAFDTARPQIIDLYSGSGQQPVYGYVIPVFEIQGMQSRPPVGSIILLLNPQEGLYPILRNKQSVTRSDESLLVKRDGPSLVYISPVKGDFKLFHRRPDNNNLLASSYAYHHPGGFKEMSDYQGENVLVTGRKIKNSPWRLVQKISSSEALAESNEHQAFLLTTFSLFVLVIATAFIAIWRHSTSLRLKLLSDALEARTDLLDSVTDNIKDNIMLVDESSRIVFINTAFSKALNMDVAEIKTKHLTSVLGKDTTKALQASGCENNDSSVMSLQINECERIYHVSTVRLTAGEYKKSILYVLHDITELKKEEEKRQQLGRGIIGTLVKAVDMHDPYCVNHSSRTREVAIEIAHELGLDDLQLETLEMASLLANIGKLFVPKEILTKLEGLTDIESEQLKKHIDFAVDILSELSFNGPVVEIISQKNERLDGSGYPNGLLSNEIRLESKILAVANAFVAMASSRAYREGRPVKEVLDILLEQSEAKYDRHVVAALFHISENKSDWKTWQSI